MAFGTLPSVRPTENGFHLNVDRSVTTFLKPGPFLDLVRELFGPPPPKLKGYQVSELRKLLVTRKVQFDYRGYPAKKKVLDITEKCANEIKVCIFIQIAVL